jgi:hypothetical protein
MWSITRWTKELGTASGVIPGYYGILAVGIKFADGDEGMVPKVETRVAGEVVKKLMSAIVGEPIVGRFEFEGVEREVKVGWSLRMMRMVVDRLKDVVGGGGVRVEVGGEVVKMVGSEVIEVPLQQLRKFVVDVFVVSFNVLAEETGRYMEEKAPEMLREVGSRVSSKKIAVNIGGREVEIGIREAISAIDEVLGLVERGGYE